MFKNTLAISIGYCLLTVAFFYPVLPFFSTDLIGPPEDNMQFYWYLWYGPQALFNPDWSFMHSNMIYHPEGVNLYYANYFYYGVAIATLLQSFLSTVQIYNLLLLTSFVFSGLTAYLLIYYLTKDKWASFIGGFVFAFNPSHVAHAEHHITIASIQFIPLLLYSFLRLIHEGKKRWLLLAVLSWTLSALCDWNYLIYNGLFVGFASIYYAIKDIRQFFSKWLLQIILLVGGVFALVSPWVIPMILLSLEHSQLQVILPGNDIYVADLFGFVVPHPYHLLANAPWVRDINATFTGNAWEMSVYLGLVNLVILVIGFLKIKNKPWPFYAGLLIFMILSMGVTLHVKGESLIPMPHALLDSIPLFKHARNPSRLIVWAYLFLAILLAFSIKAIFTSQMTKVFRRSAIVVLCALIFLDYYTVFEKRSPVVLPPSYQAIIDDPEMKEEGRSILEIPWDYGKYMMFQTIHGIPILQGYIGRKFNNPLINKIPFEMKLLPIQQKILTANKVKYIVIHKTSTRWNPNNPEKLKYYQTMQNMVNVYSKTYEKIHEDFDAATFKVY